ncbi:hypothetical protein JXB41_07220 [Candidatus Woesearchaeota archaeon]|nr:hypothetical protein [Candidatus Woesearchaeota archaeon]
MGEIINHYKELAQKYSLPDFQELNRYFYIEDIEKTDFLLNKIRDKITEKIDEYIKIIETVLQPDTNLANLYEYRYVDERKKDRIYRVFKKLMKYYRYSTEISLINEDEMNAEFIRTFYNEWTQLKQEIINILKILRNSWDIESNIKEDLSYFG